MQNKRNDIVNLIFFISIPLLSCIIFAALQGIAIWDINPLAASLGMNDELFYYKQIEGMMNNGCPMGYFGYNESTAEIGTFGTWSFTLFYPYIFLGKIIGMSPYKFILFNIILLSVAFAIFYICARPSVLQTLMILFVMIAFPTTTRFLLSGIVEGLITAGVVVFIGASIYMKDNEVSRAVIYAEYILAIYLALCRPWCLIFTLVPALAHIRKNIVEAVLAFVSSVVIFGLIYVIIVSPRCAPFFTNMVQVETLLEQLGQGIGAFIWHLKEVVISSYKGIVSFIVGNTERGIIYIVFFLDVIVLSVLLITRIIKKQFDQKTLIQALVLFIMLAVFAAIIFLYTYRYGARHFAALNLAASMMIIMQLKPDKKTIAIVAVVCVALTFLWRCKYMENHILPTDKNEDGTLPAQDAVLMETAFEADSQSDPWDNTVLFEFTELSQNYCYYLPENVGISFCYTAYVQDNNEVLKSKYLLSDNDAEKKALYCSYGWDILCEGEEYLLYQLR